MTTTFQRLYQTNRLDPSLPYLLKDIDGWARKLPSDSPLRHHLHQFHVFCEKAHRSLMNDYDLERLSRPVEPSPGDWQSDEERLMFESRVITTLLKQWEMLREATSQRVDGSPYQTGIELLDRRAAWLAARLEQAVPKSSGAGALFPSPPLVCIGPVTKLQIVGEAPAVIRLPYRALDLPRQAAQAKTMGMEPSVGAQGSWLAIAHELGHVVCERVPDLVEDVQHAVRQAWADAPPEIEALRKAILPWTEEILADVIGTTLEELDFALAAVELALSPETIAIRSDPLHPVGCLRPFVHFQMLGYLAEGQDRTKAEQDTLRDAEQAFEHLAAPLLGRNFEMSAAVTPLTLETVRDELRTLTEKILGARPKAFGARSVGQVLRDCAASRDEAPADTPRELPRWGETSVTGGKRSVLTLPSEETLDPITVVFLLALAIGL